MSYSVLQCVAVCCSISYSVLQCVAVSHIYHPVSFRVKESFYMVYLDVILHGLFCLQSLFSPVSFDIEIRSF